MTQDIEKLNPHVRQLVQSQLEAIDILEKITEEEQYARISETVFLQTILPMVTNKNSKQSLEPWQEVAGTVQRGLSVFDNTTGKELFKLPAIFAAVDKTFTGRGRESTYEILMTAEQKNKTLPTLGDRYMREKLDNRILRNSKILDTIKVWNEVLIRYNQKPLLDVEMPEEKEQQKVVEHDVEFFGEYEEL